MNDDIIEGSFYEKELQKTKNTTGEYVIEKIIKTKNDKLFVKWRGYNNSFNSWIDKNNIIKYTQNLSFKIIIQIQFMSFYIRKSYKFVAFIYVINYNSMI